MDKWEKVVTFQRELSKNKHCRSLEYFRELFDNCNRSTAYRIKDLTEILFGIGIVFDKKTSTFRFDTKDGQLTELPGLWFKKSELEALTCLQQSITSLQQGYMDDVLSPFQNRFEPILKAQGIDISAWKERFFSYNYAIYVNQCPGVIVHFHLYQYILVTVLTYCLLFTYFDCSG